MIIHGNSTKFCSNILQNHVRNIWQDISTDFKNVAQVQIWRKILAIFKSDRLGATHPAPVKCKHVKHIRVTIIRSKNINRLRNVWSIGVWTGAFEILALPKMASYKLTHVGRFKCTEPYDTFGPFWTSCELNLHFGPPCTTKDNLGWLRSNWS